MARQITGINDIPTILDQNKTNGKNEFSLDTKLFMEDKEITGKEFLELIIKNYYSDKQKLDIYKESVDNNNKIIKNLLKELNKTEFETNNGLIAKVTTQKRENFDEDKLLAKIKELGVEGIIKTKEYVDMNALENQIYQGNLDASKLNSCRISKEITVLKVAERKNK